MTRVILTARAEGDLDDIWLHIALDSPDAADRLIDRIVARAWTCAELPLFGRGRPELADGLRSVPVDAYVLFYLPIDRGIRLVRILHGARDTDTEFSAT